MVPLGVLLVAVAAVAHASWNVCAKRVPDGGAGFVWLYKVVGSLLVLPIGVVALAGQGGVDLGRALLVTAVGALFQLAYYVLLQLGYGKSDLSVIYPLSSGMAPLFSVTAAVLLLGERPGPLGLAGVAVVVAGVVIISAYRSTGDSTRTAKVYGVVFGALIGMANAAATLWDKQAVDHLDISPFLFYWGVSVFEVLLLAPVALRDRARLRGLWAHHRREVLLVGVLAPTAYVIVLFALRLAPVSVIAPAKELSVVMALLGAWLFLKEKELVRRFVGALVVTGGVLLLTYA
ncbi:EamA family transporter [Actinosynnema sp. NPDC059335]|uniref:EamA family transporter n=1 Tax=Actinosynnema sp. NPDC059335 TaxID=3346804 RepID=UPI00367109F5